MKEIYFIRHGETDINRDNKFYDDRVNIGINSKGVNQAQKTGKYLAKYRMNKKFDFILCSSLRRTRQTAKQISEQIGLNNIVYTDKLRELNTPKFLYGELQDGVRANEFNKIIKNKMNLINDPIEKYNLEFTKERFNLQRNILDELSQRNILDELDYKLAETYEEYSTRIEDIIDFIKNIDYKKIIIVSHGCLIEDLLKKIFNVCMIPKIDVDNCFICYCTLRDDIFTMISPCNSKHLSLENL